MRSIFVSSLTYVYFSLAYAMYPHLNFAHDLEYTRFSSMKSHHFVPMRNENFKTIQLKVAQASFKSSK